VPPFVQSHIAEFGATDEAVASTGRVVVAGATAEEFCPARSVPLGPGGWTCAEEITAGSACAAGTGRLGLDVGLGLASELSLGTFRRCWSSSATAINCRGVMYIPRQSVWNKCTVSEMWCIVTSPDMLALLLMRIVSISDKRCRAMLSSMSDMSTSCDFRRVRGPGGASNPKVNLKLSSYKSQITQVEVITLTKSRGVAPLSCKG
jgi:hypothetical protein